MPTSGRNHPELEGLIAGLVACYRGLTIRGGGAKVNDEVVSEEGRLIGAEQLRDGAIKLSAGRKHHRLVRAP